MDENIILSVVVFLVRYKVVCQWVNEWKFKGWPYKWQLQGSTFLRYGSLHCTRWFWLSSLWTITYPRVVFIVLYKVVVMFASESVDESSVLPFKWHLLSSTLLRYFLLPVQGYSNLESVNEISKCNHSNKSYWAEIQQTVSNVFQVWFYNGVCYS